METQDTVRKDVRDPISRMHNHVMCVAFISGITPKECCSEDQLMAFPSKARKTVAFFASFLHQ